MSYTVYVFTMGGCGHCKNLKNALTEKSLPFTEIEVSNNKKLWDQVVNQTKIDFVPTIFIKRGDSGTGPVFCPDRDFKSHEDAVEIVEKYLNENKEE